MDYTEYKTATKTLQQAQNADHDNREMVREADHFLNKRDGQWEPDIVTKLNGRPRYTFDMCNPIVDQIAGEMESADFDIRVRPAGGDATKDLAKTYDGLIRNIENLSNAVQVYNQAGRAMVGTGIGGWRIVPDWAQSDSFDQDLFIRPISNFEDRVWFDPGSELQDRSDAEWCHVLHVLTTAEYEERFPEGSGLSVGSDKRADVYSYKAEQVIIGEFLYKKKETKNILLMSNGATYVEDDDFKKVRDELEEQGIKVQRERKRESHTVYTRLYDGGDWLTKETETVFEWLPVIPTYGNYRISENKVIYRGVVEKLIDPQRVYNYAQSRQIEEGALAPRAKYWMVREQAKGSERQLQTLNTNADPVQFYTHIDNVPPPYQQGGAQINPGLAKTAEDASRALNVAAGLFNSNLGDNPGFQSGVAIELQQNKGDNGTIKYFKSQEIAICHTARILINAIPKVYDARRQVRVLNEDGSFDMVMLNDQEFDQDTGEMVTLNDLSKGQYDVTCDVGDAFKNRQQETVRAFTELAAIDPTILSTGADILLNNIQTPGIDLLADRTRAQLLKSGMIPDDQMTDEEKEQMQAFIEQQQQIAESQGPDAAQQIAQAEIEKANAQTADTLSKIEERQNKMALEAEKLGMQQTQMVLDAQQQTFEQQQQINQAIVSELKTQAETLKTIREAMGADAIVGPANTEAYKQQSEIVVDSQDQIT